MGVKCDDCGTVFAPDETIKADEPCDKCKRILNTLRITSIQQIKYCPTCGAKTEHEPLKYEYRVTCPEHGIITLD